MAYAIQQYIYQQDYHMQVYTIIMEDKENFSYEMV